MRTFILQIIKPLTVLLVLFSGIVKNDFAQLPASHFFGNYECIRTGNNGSDAASLIVYQYNGNDTIFRIKDTDLNGGSWDLYCYLNQDSTFIGTIYPIYGHFYGVDSIYMHYYENNFPYGGHVYEYYGRNLNVGIEQNSLITEPIGFIYNPTDKNIQIINKSSTGVIQCDLFSIAGVKIISQSIHSSPGEINKLFSGHLPGGVYILRLSGWGYARTGKIVVK